MEGILAGTLARDQFSHSDVYENLNKIADSDIDIWISYLIYVFIKIGKLVFL